MAHWPTTEYEWGVATSGRDIRHDITPQLGGESAAFLRGYLDAAIELDEEGDH